MATINTPTKANKRKPAPRESRGKLSRGNSQVKMPRTLYSTTLHIIFSGVALKRENDVKLTPMIHTNNKRFSNFVLLKFCSAQKLLMKFKRLFDQLFVFVLNIRFVSLIFEIFVFYSSLVDKNDNSHSHSLIQLKQQPTLEQNLRAFENKPLQLYLYTAISNLNIFETTKIHTHTNTII